MSKDTYSKNPESDDILSRKDCTRFLVRCELSENVVTVMSLSDTTNAMKIYDYREIGKLSRMGGRGEKASFATVVCARNLQCRGI